MSSKVRGQGRALAHTAPTKGLLQDVQQCVHQRQPVGAEDPPVNHLQGTYTVSFQH